MKYNLVCLAFALSVMAAADQPVAAKVADVLAKPASYDQKQIRIPGKVSAFQQRTSKSGNKYFVFKLEDKDKKLSVYGRGELMPAPKNGSRVEVEGKFRRQNKVGNQIFKDEIETNPKGVKVAK
jgi:cytochrome c-type biogenesis protein CcmE